MTLLLTLLTLEASCTPELTPAAAMPHVWVYWPAPFPIACTPVSSVAVPDRCYEEV